MILDVLAWKKGNSINSGSIYGVEGCGNDLLTYCDHIAFLKHLLFNSIIQIDQIDQALDSI